MTTDFETSVHFNSDLEALLIDAPTAPAGNDDMRELNALLFESLNAKKDALRVREARKTLANGGMSPADRDATAAMVKEWELKREWTPRSNTMILDVQHCTNCGKKHSHFLGLFQGQEHKTSKITRWVSAAPVVGLPKVLKEQVNHVAICIGCAPAQGWN